MKDVGMVVSNIVERRRVLYVARHWMMSCNNNKM